MILGKKKVYYLEDDDCLHRKYEKIYRQIIRTNKVQHCFQNEHKKPRVFLYNSNKSLETAKEKNLI